MNDNTLQHKKYKRNQRIENRKKKVKKVIRKIDTDQHRQTAKKILIAIAVAAVVCALIFAVYSIIADSKRDAFISTLVSDYQEDPDAALEKYHDTDIAFNGVVYLTESVDGRIYVKSPGAPDDGTDKYYLRCSFTNSNDPDIINNISPGDVLVIKGHLNFTASKITSGFDSWVSVSEVRKK